MYFLVFAALITGIIMLSTAFAATTAYQNLIGLSHFDCSIIESVVNKCMWTDDLNDMSGEFDMSPGYSFQLMLSAGVIGIPALGCSVATAYFYSKQDQPSSESLSASLTADTKTVDSNQK